ncbi:MAG: hypothetical protein QM702_04235 [Rubrivivax sp.]
MPTPLSCTLSRTCAPSSCSRTCTPPSKGELQRVGQQVQHDLLPHAAVDEDLAGDRPAVDLERDAGAVEGRAEAAGQIGREPRQVGRLVSRDHAPGLQPREVEQRVDQLQQPQLVAVDGVQRGAAEHALGRTQRVLGRPDHQRQRRAELVADVAEEGRLLAVDLGQRLGAAALLLERACAAQRAGDLVGRQPEELRITVVDFAQRVQPGDQVAQRGRAGAGLQRDDGHLARRHVPAPARRTVQRRRQRADEEPRGAGFGRGDRPGVCARRGHRAAAIGLGVRESGLAGQLQRAGVVVQIEQRERQVGVVLGEYRRDDAADTVGRTSAGGARAQVAQQLQLALALHLGGGLLAGDEHAGDAGVVVARRAVREGEVGLLNEALALHRQQQVLVPGGAAAFEHTQRLRPEDVPDLGPDLGGGAAERLRVLGRQHRHVGVVVDQPQLVAPPQRHRKPAVQHQRRGRTQADRPRVPRAQRRLAPGMGACQLGHGSGTGGRVVHRASPRRAGPAGGKNGARGPRRPLFTPFLGRIKSWGARTVNNGSIARPSRRNPARQPMNSDSASHPILYRVVEVRRGADGRLEKVFAAYHPDLAHVQRHADFIAQCTTATRLYIADHAGRVVRQLF